MQLVLAHTAQDTGDTRGGVEVGGVLVPSLVGHWHNVRQSQPGSWPAFSSFRLHLRCNFAPAPLIFNL